MNDLQMARGFADGGYNLAIGEPGLIQIHAPIHPSSVLCGPYHYPTMEGDPDLVKELRHLHPKGEIVVTVGAKQAIAALFYAYKKLGYVGVSHKAPYWPSYPTLAQMAGLLFNQDTPPNLTVMVNTSPNNPDGRVSDRSCHIWDAVYASEAYRWEGSGPIGYQVKVLSAAKLLGLSGARVGWLVTEESQIAHGAREYVELATAGVSVPAQKVVADALHDLRTTPYNGWRLRVIHGVYKNCKEFERVIRPFCARSCGTENHGRGMFAFFQIKPEHLRKFRLALADAKVFMVTGEACGMTEPGWFRMNLGLDTEYTAEALKKLEEHLR